MKKNEMLKISMVIGEISTECVPNLVYLNVVFTSLSIVNARWIFFITRQA